MSIVSLYRPITNDYRFYFEENPDLFIDSKDQYSGTIELTRLYGQSVKYNEFQSNEISVGGESAVLDRSFRKKWCDGGKVS